MLILFRFSIQFLTKMAREVWIISLSIPHLPFLLEIGWKFKRTNSPTINERLGTKMTKKKFRYQNTIRSIIEGPLLLINLNLMALDETTLNVGHHLKNFWGYYCLLWNKNPFSLTASLLHAIAMASKLMNGLRALYTATNHHRILSSHNGAQRAFLFSSSRLASDVPSLSSPSSAPPPQIPQSIETSLAPSSLNQKELAKFAAIAETWSALYIW